MEEGKNNNTSQIHIHTQHTSTFVIYHCVPIIYRMRTDCSSLFSLLVVLLLALVSVKPAKGLQYAPNYHLYFPGQRVGHPSTPFRDPITDRLDVFVELCSLAFGTTGERVTPTPLGWGNVASLNYTKWFRSAGEAVALRPVEWYNEKGSCAGSISLNEKNEKVTAYSCNGSSGVTRICFAATLPSSNPFVQTTLVQSVFNPVLSSASLTMLDVERGYFKDPTGWWRSDGGENKWLIGVATHDRTLGAAVALFSTTDPSYYQRQAYTYSHLLYSDHNFTIFGTPDFFTVTDDYFLKLTMLDAERDYVVYGSYTDREVFVEDGTRPPSFLDLGSFVASKVFADPLTRTVRLIGSIPEDLVDYSQEATQGWAGVLSMMRVISYNAEERRLQTAPEPELKALRIAQVFSSLEEMVLRAENSAEESFLMRPLQLTQDATPYHEIVVDFEIPSDWSSNADGPEVGIMVRGDSELTRYTAISLRMPTSASCKASGGVGDGVEFRSFPLYDEFNDDNVEKCSELCQENTICDRWDAVLQPYGMDCHLYTLSSKRRSGVVCGTTSGCPLESPLLIMDRTNSGSSGNTSSIRGRAALRRQGPQHFQLHVYIDGSVVEVFKDGGLEALTGRLYVPESQNTIGLFARHLGSGSQVKAQVKVYTMGSMWGPDGESVWGRELEDKIEEYSKNYGKAMI